MHAKMLSIIDTIAHIVIICNILFVVLISEVLL
jgi:hypothetical protein